MIITNTQLHEATPTRTPVMCLNDIEAQMKQATCISEYDALESMYWEVYRELFGEEDIFTDVEIEAMQDDLFVPQDQRHLDRISYLAINELCALPQQPGHTYDALDADLLDVIYSTLRMENALDIRDIWS